MTVCVHSNMPAPHQLPMAGELARWLGANNFAFVHTERLSDERIRVGWAQSSEPWVVASYDNPDLAQSWLEQSSFLLSGERDFRLFDRRVNRRGLITAYGSERWFKPLSFTLFGREFEISGFWRMLFPKYIKMAYRMTRLLRQESFYYWAYGIHAATDMARLVGLFSGDVRCLFSAPRLSVERVPCGRVRIRGAKRHWDSKLAQMRIWGYSVEPSSAKVEAQVRGGMGNDISVLWVGRMLCWKRLDTLVKAVAGLKCLHLDIYGAGPCERLLRKLARKNDNIVFHGFVPIGRVRELMREHDVYVMPSGAGEGWGAVVNECLEEGVPVLGTYEAGSSATILPEGCLFHAGDWRRLRSMLQKPIPVCEIGPWSAEALAKAIRRFCDER